VRLGVLGGTFDPVHYLHLILAEGAREQLSLDKVLFVPAGQPWRKADRAITPPEHRVAMLRLACRRNDAFVISTLEIDRGGPSYTIDTLQELHGARPDAKLFFILGEDAFADLPNWKSPELIKRRATLAVAGRAIESTAADTPLPPNGPTIGLVRLASPLLAISASDIRGRVRQGRSIRYLVAPEVERYIIEHGLYKD